MTKILEYILFVLLWFVTLLVLYIIYLWFHNPDIQIIIIMTSKTHWAFTICQVLDILAYLILPTHNLLGWYQPFLYDNQRNGRSFVQCIVGNPPHTRLPTLCSSGILKEGGGGRSWVHTTELSSLEATLEAAPNGLLPGYKRLLPAFEP